ncbi:MAG: hypothetical protein BWZ10_01107 [candidate division BRC1 bacterium ADurb.BinA364]|nr:MAG: hypothetical protein BWZ10_01107 [candidate division BRC1 bacterium ADurb.BinA364]
MGKGRMLARLPPLTPSADISGEDNGPPIVAVSEIRVESSRLKAVLIEVTNLTALARSDSPMA